MLAARKVKSMGIFGGVGRALSKPGADGLSLGERLAIFATAAGGDIGSAMAIRNAPAQRAQLAQRDAFGRQLAGMLGPQYAETQGAGAAIQAPSMPGMPQAEAAPEYQWQAPQRISDGLNINSPELGALMLQAQNAKYDMSGLMDVLKAQKPDIAFTPSNEAYDKGTGRLTGMVAPKTGEGQTLRRDALGGIAGIENAPNYTRALMESEAAKTMGQETAKAGFDMVEVKIGGQVAQLPRSVALPLITAAFGRDYPNGLPENFGRTVAPEVQTYRTDAAKAQVERDFTRPKAQAALSAMDAKTKVVDDAINRVLGINVDPRTGKAVQGPSMVSGWTTGAGSVLAGIPGSPAKDLQAAIETIKANIGFDELQTMRDNSPTGGALGQVAVQELEALRATLSSLDQAQSPEQVVASLKRIQEIRRDSAARRREAFDATYGNPSGGAPVAPAPVAPAPAQRVRNKVYQTPRGPLVWTGTGWMQP